MPRYQKIYDRDGYRCVYCKLPLWEELRIWHCSTEDHLYPRSQEHRGSDSHENLVTACQLCNSLKSSYIPRPFADGPGVLVDKGGKIEVHSDFRDEYLRLVAEEIERRRVRRETEFTNEKRRIKKA